MKLTYTRISKTLTKYFWEGEGTNNYGEFYIKHEPTEGTAELFINDPEYAAGLTPGFLKAITDCITENYNTRMENLKEVKESMTTGDIQ